MVRTQPSALKFLDPFGKPTDTVLVQPSQTPIYPDKGVQFAGHAKIQTSQGYTLKRQEQRVYSLTNQSALADTTQVRPNAATHDFFCTDLFIQFSRVQHNLSTPAPYGIFDNVALANIQRFIWYIPYSSWVAAADLSQNFTANAERGDIIEIWENGLYLHFTVPLPFYGTSIVISKSGHASQWLHVELMGFDEEK